jgi:CBS domain-containing protein
MVGRPAGTTEFADARRSTHMTVGEICNPNVATIGAGDSIVDAATLMRQQHVGTLIVLERRRGAAVPIGILTDRDIAVGIVAKRVAPDSVNVGDVMTRDLLTVREDASLEFALREMRRRGVRRVPVVRATDGDLVGIVAIDDIIQHLAMQLERLADVIRVEQCTEQRARP